MRARYPPPSPEKLLTTIHIAENPELVLMTNLMTSRTYGVDGGNDGSDDSSNYDEGVVRYRP